MAKCLRVYCKVSSIEGSVLSKSIRKKSLCTLTSLSPPQTRVGLPCWKTPSWNTRSHKVPLSFGIVRRSLINSFHFAQNASNKFDVGRCSLPGRREKNEDRFRIATLASGEHLLAIFDGHRGSFASKFVGEELPSTIESLLDTKLDPDKGQGISHPTFRPVLEEAFNSCQENLRREIEKREDLGPLVGTTALVAVLTKDGWLTLAQAGDSKAVLCRGGEVVTLTDDHTPANDEEANRVLSMGGWIDWDSRMFPLVNGQLQMTRSLGDLDLKKYGVTSTPAIRQLLLDQEKDSFLVLCSDGVTHTISDDEIVHIVAQHTCPAKAAQSLACSAQQYGSTDDVTCLVIPFSAWGKYVPVKKSFSHFRMALGFRGDG